MFIGKWFYSNGFAKINFSRRWKSSFLLRFLTGGRFKAPPPPPPVSFLIPLSSPFFGLPSFSMKQLMGRGGGDFAVPVEGASPAKQKDTRLLPALLALVEPDARGDPQSPLHWTIKSTRCLPGS
jgi:hypothetical protein